MQCIEYRQDPAPLLAANNGRIIANSRRRAQTRGSKLPQSTSGETAVGCAAGQVLARMAVGKRLEPARLWFAVQ